MMENNKFENKNEYAFENLLEKYREGGVELLKERKFITKEEIENGFKDEKVLVCDVYVKDIENHREGDHFRDGNIYSIDHHAPLKEFQQKISSANIAIEYVRNNGPIGKDFKVITNHTDADSVLACLIMRGVLPPDDRFAKAAIAADHTGEKNEIADLLQAIQYERDIELAVRNLQLLLDGEPLEKRAADLLKERDEDRIKAEKMVEEGNIQEIGGVSYVELEKKIDPNFFIPMIPGAMIIVTFSKHGDFPERLETRVRLGEAGLEKGVSLLELGIEDIDPNWGGRWNAGSDKRGGGTDLLPDEYVRKLNDRLQDHLDKEGQ
ncbi:MAG: hypothetical protein WC788_02810 [Candidatus Paceibacterota bacterium]|jgi:hypothetical protein